MTQSSPWLTEKEMRAWLRYIEASRAVSAALDRQLRADSSLSHDDYEVLSRLSMAPDRCMRMSELAAVVEFSASRLSHMIGRMEHAGWIVREPCPTDRRGTNARLTDAGFEVVEEAAPGHAAEVRRLVFDPLTPEQVGQLETVFAAIGRGDGAAQRAG